MRIGKVKKTHMLSGYQKESGLTRLLVESILLLRIVLQNILNLKTICKLTIQMFHYHFAQSFLTIFNTTIMHQKEH